MMQFPVARVQHTLFRRVPWSLCGGRGLVSSTKSTVGAKAKVSGTTSKARDISSVLVQQVQRESFQREIFAHLPVAPHVQEHVITNEEPCWIQELENFQQQALVHFPREAPAEKKDVSVVAEPSTLPLRPSYEQFQSQLRPASQVVVFNGSPDDPHGASNTPLYQTGTFRQPSATKFGQYDYTRSGNPTRTALEKHAAILERASVALSFSTGMSALSMVMRLADGSKGEEVLCCDDVYGGMHRLISQVLPKQGVKHRFIDCTDPQHVLANLTPETKIVHIETPSNPLMRICDVRGLAEVLRPRGVKLSVDASAMSPLLMKPLDLGADVVVHSATKHFSGHADCMGGLVCVRDEAIAKEFAFLQNAEGNAIAPMEAWLLQRGMKTMSLRLERSQENARKICNFLSQHPQVQRIYWPGLEGGSKNAVPLEQRLVHASQTNGPGTLLSFETGSVRFSRRLMDACRIFKITVSFGSVHSLCEMPCDMSHASIPDGLSTIPRDLIRLSIGIEDFLDLEDDLQQAFALASRDDIPDEALSGLDFDSKFEDFYQV